MTYFPVSAPYEIFNDLDGDPLEDGYIYIGEANQNPITNQITVYWDSTGLYPAAQPIRTIGGYPSLNGTPSKIFVNAGAFEDYSILINDKNGRFVFSLKSARFDSIASGNVVDFFNDLRSISGYDQPIDIRWHSTIGDGGKGRFEWFDGVAPGTYIDDNGRIAVPTGGDGSGAWLRQSKTVLVTDYGAIGSGTDNDTTAVQNAFDNNAQIHFPEGTYLCNNLSLNSSTAYRITGAGYDKTSIKAISTISDTDYLIACSNWINNVNSGGNRFEISGISFNGDGYVKYPFVVYNYFGRLIKCRFQRPSASGYALIISDQTKNGTVCSTSLVENRVDKCRIDGNSVGGSIQVTGNSKVTDGFLTECLVYNGASVLSSLAGWNISENHFYSSAVTFNKISIGTRIENNYFENTVKLNDFITNTINYDSNHHNDNLTVSFGNSGNIAVLNNCVFWSTAKIVHDYFSPSKKIIVNGGNIESSSIASWTNGSSTGVITFNRFWKTSDSLYVNGWKTAATGKLVTTSMKESYSVSQVSAVAQTITWGTSANTLYVAGAGASPTVTFTLSTSAVEEGASFHIIRPVTAYTNIDVGGLKTLDTTIGQWCTVEYINASWRLKAFGDL